MRKSNWIIAAVLLLASVAFLWIWHALQFDLVDNPLDIVVTVVWWVVIVAACVAIQRFPEAHETMSCITPSGQMTEQYTRPKRSVRNGSAQSSLRRGCSTTARWEWCV